MKIIKHNLPLYYNPRYNGFNVIHSYDDNTIILGGCSSFIDDSYTNYSRYKLPKSYLKELVRINKSKLSKYSFISKSSEHVISPIATSKYKDNTHLFYKNPFIIP